MPLHYRRGLFGFSVLDSFWAGLTWQTILHKREDFRHVLDIFVANEIANYTDEDQGRLLSDVGIVRNRLKLSAIITIAKSFLAMQKEVGSFVRYIWRVTGHRTRRNLEGVIWNIIPASTKEPEALSKDLKGRGFRFAGTTTYYAVMQAAGMVNDHINDCICASTGGRS